MDLYKLKYPIGEYTPNKHPDHDLLQRWIADIASFPARLSEAAAGLSTEQLNWTYRPGGWAIKQVIHHCADSHINSITRFKLTLTEDTPTIRPYDQDLWATLIDSQNDDIEPSLSLLTGLHQRWANLLSSLTEAELQREFMHPEHVETFNLAETIGNYAWHGNHHYAHVLQGIASNGAYT